MAKSNDVLIKVNVRLLVILLVVALIPMAVDGFLILDQSRTTFDRTVGSQFEMLAGQAMFTIEEFVNRRVVDLGALALNGEIRHAVALQNASYPKNRDAAAAAIKKMDDLWNTSNGRPQVTKILGNAVTQFLREYQATNDVFKRILITDEMGALVASTTVAPKYSYANDHWWIESYGNGQTGSVVVEDVEFDSASKVNGITVVVPIRASSQSERIIGIMRATVDVSGLFPLVARIKMGRTGQATLIKEDGTIIASPAEDLVLKKKFDAAEDIFQYARRAGNILAGFTQATVAGQGPQVVGFAKSQLGSSFPHLKWWTIVYQSTTEAHQPIQSLMTRVMLTLLIFITLVVAFSLYLAMHRRLRFVDLERPEGADEENIEIPRH